MEKLRSTPRQTLYSVFALSVMVAAAVFVYMGIVVPSQLPQPKDNALVVQCVYDVKPPNRPKFLDVLKKLVPEVKASSGVVQFVVAEDIATPNKFFTSEIYDDADVAAKVIDDVIGKYWTELKESVKQPLLCREYQTKEVNSFDLFDLEEDDVTTAPVQTSPAATSPVAPAPAPVAK